MHAHLFRQALEAALSRRTAWGKQDSAARSARASTWCSPCRRPSCRSEKQLAGDTAASSRSPQARWACSACRAHHHAVRRVQWSLQACFREGSCGKSQGLATELAEGGGVLHRPAQRTGCRPA